MAVVLEIILGGSCDGGGQCSEKDHLVCDSDECKCDSGYFQKESECLESMFTFINAENKFYNQTNFASLTLFLLYWLSYSRWKRKKKYNVFFKKWKIVHDCYKVVSSRSFQRR